MAEVGAPPARPAPLVQLCTFRVAGEDYALDVMRVREIVNPLPITPVPRAPAFVEGVVRLRGDVVPVVDVRRRFGLAPVPPGRHTKFVVVNLGGRRVALVVDEVCDVLRIPRADIRPVPALAALDAPRFFLGACGGGRASPQPARRGADPGRLRLLLDVKALFEPARPGDGLAALAQADAARRTA